MASSLPAAPLEPVLPSPAGLGAEPVPRDVVGAVEVVTAKRIAGWAVDRTAADRRLTVEVLADGVTLGRVTAERPRTDLARSGPGDGCHGFELRCPEPLSPSQLERIEAFALVGADATGRMALPVRRADGSFPPVPRAVPAPPWIAELATLCRTIEQHARRLAEIPVAPPRPAGVPGEVTELHELMGGLAARLDGLDALHPRLDGLAARLEELAHAGVAHRRPQRGLAWAVALTAGLALASLGTGIAGYWF